MGEIKLIEVPDSAALPAMNLLSRRHTKQGEAGVVTLIFTGKRLQDLLELEGLTTQPHYGIRGFLNADLDAKAEVAHLLAGDSTEVFLSLHYPWGDLPLYFRRGTSNKHGTLTIIFDPPSRGWFLKGILSGLLPILGLEEAATGPIPGGGKLVVTSYENAATEGIQLFFPAEQASRVEAFLREIVGRLEVPSKVHVILTTDLKTVRDLHESGKIVPCGSCCSWHFGYVDLLGEESDVDTARLDEVVGFLAKRLGRERVLTFRGFTWNWEEGFDPALVNAVVWNVPKRGSGWIKVRWPDEDLPPRGTTATLKKEMEQLLAGLH